MYSILCRGNILHHLVKSKENISFMIDFPIPLYDGGLRGLHDSTLAFWAMVIVSLALRTICGPWPVITPLCL